MERAAARKERRKLKQFKRRNLKRFIRPQNADWIAEMLPLEPGASLHVISPGNFIFCDLLVKLAERLRPSRCLITTLSLSRSNVDQLVKIAAGCSDIRLLVSSYWMATDKQQARHYLCEQGIATRQLRIHTKYVTFDESYSISGSANLRSSGCIEQFTIAHDPDLARWYADCFEEAYQAAQPLKQD